jgi:hypothetical protein
MRTRRFEAEALLVGRPHRDGDKRVAMRRVRVTLGSEGKDAGAVLGNAAALGLDVHAMTEQLQADAVTAFASSFDQLVATVAERRRQVLTAAS